MDTSSYTRVSGLHYPPTRSLDEQKLWDEWAIRWKREVSLFRPAREWRERREGWTMQMELFAGRVHYDYFNNGNIRRAFDEKSEFNEKFTDEPRLWRYNYINNTGAREIGDRRFVTIHPRINIILIQKEQKLSDILRTGDIILYKSESIHQNVRFHLKTATRILLIQHYKWTIIIRDLAVNTSRD